MTDGKILSNKTSREIVLDLLMDIIENKNFSHRVLNTTLNKYIDLSKQDRAFITRICEGTVERLITIDYILDLYSTIKVNKMKPLIRNVMRMSLYQMKYMEGVPDSAICNEAVKIVRKRGFQSLSGFVNGVLRNVIRHPEKVVFPEETKELEASLSIRYSVPLWMVSFLLKQYDLSIVKGILESSFQNNATSIRCNLNITTVEEVIQSLEKEKVTVEKASYLSYGLKIDGYNSLNKLQSFQNGSFVVQDESSMLVGQISGVKKDSYVIDVCAAPGGKTLHIADLLQGSGHVDARDVSEYKVQLIQENINRVGCKNISLRVQDALEYDENSKHRADLVIADLPCSGLGVLGKKSDIKYNMDETKLKDLVKLQQSILDVVQNYVSDEGRLIFSTCTINKEENIENLQWFTKNYPFQLESLDEFLPNELQCETTKFGYLQLIPGVHQTDGFFIAKLKRCEG